jgi:hypothetical protein
MAFSARNLTLPIGTEVQFDRKTLLSSKHPDAFRRPLLIWDNTGVMHRVTPYPLGNGYMMHCTTLVGEEALA